MRGWLALQIGTKDSRIRRFSRSIPSSNIASCGRVISTRERIARFKEVEHIGKRFVGRDGELVDTGEVEPRVLYAPKNQLLFDAAVDAIEANDLVSTIIPKVGVLPLFGETQSYFLQGVPSFSPISFPEYLFYASDTIDKVAADQLVPVMSTVLDIVDAAMYLPATWLKQIDR